MTQTRPTPDQINNLDTAIDDRIALVFTGTAAQNDLANLAPTQINQDLLPNPDNTKALGSGLKRWTSLSTLLVKFYNAAGTFYTGIKAGNPTANVEFVLPVADGTVGQVLKTDGMGNLSFTTPAGGGGGANQALSNLTNPTSINQDLIPATDATRTIGSLAKLFESVNAYILYGGFGSHRSYLAASNSNVNILLKNNSIPISPGMPYITTEASDLAIVPGINNLSTQKSLYLGTPDRLAANGGTNTGVISAVTGDTDNGASGNIVLKTGLASTVRGKITLDAILNLPAQAAPATPINGDLWFDGTDVKIRVAGVTKTFTLT